MNKPFGRSLEQNIKDLQQEKFEDGLPVPDEKTSVANLIGLMGTMAVDTIVADIGHMIDKGLRKEIDGYVLALSRIMRHDFAWKCVVTAFAKKHEPTPSKYAPYFGDQSQTPPDKPMTVE